MRSRRLRLLALVAFLTAALVPGAAVFVRPAYACSLYQVDSPGQLVPDSEVIVIGRVVSTAGGSLVLRPEAFLKGPASAEDIALAPNRTDCPTAALNDGDRALIYIADAAKPAFPLITEAYLLADGHATMTGAKTRSESEVVAEIRGLTGQYAVPAATAAEGAGIDWGSTIIPLGIALAIIFGIGLFLMRVWHRIDPS